MADGIGVQETECIFISVYICIGLLIKLLLNKLGQWPSRTGLQAIPGLIKWVTAESC